MRCFYNHDMCSVASNVTATHNYDKPINKEHVQSFVYDIADTDVDTFTCCPTMLRQPLWPSEVMPHWKNETPLLKEPELCHDWTYFEYVYYRLRRYILAGGDPVGDTVEAAKECGKKIFFSYRMNDVHMFTENPDSLHIDSFWKMHPEYRIGHFEKEPALVSRDVAEMMQDYLKPEIYNHYLSVLEELTRMYDIDGLEFDFMRSPCFFSPDRMEEGISVMTAFVRDVRKMLDRYGKERGKRLELSARLPDSPEKAIAAGLDFITWSRDCLIDFINVNSSFFSSTNLAIEEYKRLAPNVSVLAELQFALANGKKIGNYQIRKVTKEQYRTFAHSFLERGADGISLYNFTFYRHHHFNDPRRGMLPGTEPPFDVLKGITDIMKLKHAAKHFYWGKDVIKQPLGKRRMSLEFDTFDDLVSAKEAKLRIETKEISHGIEMNVLLNGEKLIEHVDTGELYRPVSAEGLPINEQLRYFDVPLTLIKFRNNELTVDCLSAPKRSVDFIGAELAIYR